MARIQESVEIAAPPERVWAVAQDYARRRAWDTRVLDAVVEPGAAGAVALGAGARVRYRFRMLPGVTFWLVLEYLVFEPPVRSAIRCAAASWLAPYRDAKGSWQLGACAGGTRFQTTFQYTLRYGWWGRLLDRWLVERRTVEETRASLARLKELVERGGAPLTSRAP